MVPSPVSNTGASQRLTSRQQGGYQYVTLPSRPPPARSSLDEGVHDSERCCLWNCGQYPLVMVTYRKPSSFPPSTAHPSLLSLSEAIMSLVQRHHLQASLVVRDIKNAGRRAWEDPQNRPRWRCSSVVELLTGRSRTHNSFFPDCIYCHPQAFSWASPASSVAFSWFFWFGIGLLDPEAHRIVCILRLHLSLMVISGVVSEAFLSEG